MTALNPQQNIWPCQTGRSGWDAGVWLSIRSPINMSNTCGGHFRTRKALPHGHTMIITQVNGPPNVEAHTGSSETAPLVFIWL
jgi:hypothetical protein